MAQAQTAGRYTARQPADGEDWAAVAHALNRRMAARRIGQQELADLSGVSVSTLRQLQRGGQGRRVQNKTLSAVASALGWPEDHLVRVLTGMREDDAPSADSADPLVLAELRALRHDLRRALRRIDELERLTASRADA
jgi:transcriptional regulator with XRE-family HTH domain